MNNISQYFSSELTNALGWTFIHSLWQGSLLTILLLICYKVFKLNSSGKYWGGLLTMSALLTTSIFTLIQYLDDSPAIARMATSTILTIGHFETLQDFQSIDRLEQYLPIIAWSWLLGALFYAIKLCGGFVQLHRLKRIEISPVPKQWENRFNKLLAITKIDHTVKILQSTKVDVPMVLGYFKPIILIPVGLISGLSADQVEAILLHELSHIKRHDFLINIFQSIIEVIFYYHPVVWWLSSQVRKEREHCCDDQIIAHGVDKLIYANALTNVNAISFTQNKLTMGLANNKNDLLNRIKRLVEGQDQSSTNFYTKGIPLLVLITVLMSFSWYQQNQLPNEHTEEATLVELAPSLIVEIMPVDDHSLDTMIIEELQPASSEKRVKTTITWADDEETTYEVVQDSDEDSENHWNTLEDHLNSMYFDIDMGHIVEELAELKDLGIDISRDFDQSFDFNFNGKLDTLPELHLEHMKRIQEELAHVKESMNDIHFDFRDDSELTDEQKENMEREMREMELTMRDKVGALNDLHRKDRLDREMRQNKEQLRAERHRNRELQSREFQEQHEGFSTQRMEQKMQRAEKEMEKREEEMKVWEKSYEIYQKALVKQLKADGYLDKREKLNNFEMSDDKIKVNGNTIDAKDLKKYQELKNKYLDK